MTVSPENGPLTASQRFVALASLAVLLLGAYVVVRPFLVPILWAAILAYATWPLFRLLERYFPRPRMVTSLAMTLAVILLLFGPAVLISLSLSEEIATALDALRNLSRGDQAELLGLLERIPHVGSALEERIRPRIADPEALRQSLLELGRHFSGSLREIVGGAARNLVKLGIALITVFFLYLHGHAIVDQARRAADQLGGKRLWTYMSPVTETVNAVLFGLILTALAQGLLAGLAYAVAGLPVPALLGLATGLLALIPFGAPLIWVPAGVALLLQEQWLAGLGVLLWGLLVVSWVDNLVRPMLISAGTRIPFLLVFFGVIGGAMAFGLIGLFLGPIILSVVLTVWREWTQAHAF